MAAYHLVTQANKRPASTLYTRQSQSRLMHQDHMLVRTVNTINSVLSSISADCTLV